MMIFDVSQVSEEIGLHVQDSWCSIWTGWKQLQRSSTLISNSCPVMGTGFMEVMRPEPSSSWLPHLNRFDSIFVRVKSQSLGLRCMCTSIHARWPPEEWSIFEPPKETRLGLFKQQKLMAWIITDADSHCFCGFFQWVEQGDTTDTREKAPMLFPSLGHWWLVTVTMMPHVFSDSLRKRHLLVALKLF